MLAGVKGALASFLGSCTSLETLCAPAELATFEVLEAASTAWKEARGGAAPLAHLKLYGYAAYNNDPFASPAAAGGWFGNLESFTPRSYGPGVEEGWTHVPTFTKMNRLKSLHVGPLSQGRVPCISTTALGQLSPVAGGGPESGAPLGAGRPPVKRDAEDAGSPDARRHAGDPAAVAQESRTHGRRDPTAESRDPLAREGGVGVPPQLRLARRNGEQPDTTLKTRPEEENSQLGFETAWGVTINVLPWPTDKDDDDEDDDDDSDVADDLGPGSPAPVPTSD